MAATPSWYHGRITRAEAEQRLQGSYSLESGAFLVRGSTRGDGAFALSIWSDNKDRVGQWHPLPPPAQSALFCVDSREHTEVWLFRPPYTVDGEPKSVSSRGGTLLVSKLCRRPQSMLTPSPAINRTKALPNQERGRLRTKASCRDSNLWYGDGPRSKVSVHVWRRSLLDFSHARCKSCLKELFSEGCKSATPLFPLRRSTLHDPQTTLGAKGNVWFNV